MRLGTLLTHPVVQALGGALLHFLWQGSLLALLLWIVKSAAPQSARARYAAATLIMLAMPVALIVTVARDLRLQPLTVKIAPMVSSHAPAAAGVPRENLLAALPASAPGAGVSGWAVCVWVAGVLLLSLRAFGGWTRAQRLTRGVVRASGEFEALLLLLKRRLGISAPVCLYTSAIVQVPTVIGWLRPYILLPVITLTGLSESQIEAILAHELAHIRRHDYLVNLLQTAIETVLFYHPAVWWTGQQMRLEREHCCDDIAVAVCGNAVEYAKALAELEQLRSIPEPALAATGGELLGRIRRLLDAQPSEHDASRSLGSIAAAVAVILLIVGAPAVAQQPTFDVASIKPNVSGPGPRYSELAGGTVVFRNQTLKNVLVATYQVPSFRIVGGPGWISSDSYDIEAKAGGIATPDQKRQMLQTLLQDRFKLAVHRETKELPIYELTVARGGIKVQPLKEGSCIIPDPNQPPAPAGPLPICDSMGVGKGLVDGKAASPKYIAIALSMATGRTVIDKTGVTERFAIHVTFVPDEVTADAPAADSSGPSLFTALQEQLGLKLESTKGPVDVLVIDHVEKPTGN